MARGGGVVATRGRVLGGCDDGIGVEPDWHAVIDAGGTIQRTFLGAGSHPTAFVEASAPPWTLFKGFALSDGSGVGWVGVGFWDVGEVARNPCHSIGHTYDPGPIGEGS